MKSIEYQRQWRKNNPEKVKRYNKEKYQRDKEYNPERLKRKAIKQKEWHQRHREYQRTWSRKKLCEFREKIFDKLGHTCIKCGYSDKRALCVDHINAGGVKELRSMSVFAYYKKVLIDTKEKYQILCHNCNWIKKSENNEVRKSNQ